MALSTISTLQDIQKYLQGIILAHKPGANVERGFPLWDLMVGPFAKIVYNERLYVNLTNNLARVLPLFDDAGNLKDSSFEEFLVNKYFIGSEEINASIFTLYLFFNKPCDVAIQNGSTVFYNNQLLDVDPLYSASDDDNWKQNSRGYYIPIVVSSSENAEFSIGNTEAWDISNLNLDIQTEGAEVLFAYNISVLNSSVTPVLTLDTVKNSISNRSFSNTRSLAYQLRANSAFYPEELKQYEILKFADRHYIDNYFEYLRDDSGVISFKTSGEGKILMDYGLDYYTKAVTLEYLSEGHHYTFSTSNIVQEDVYKQVSSLNVYGVTSDNSDIGTLYWGISEIENGGARQLHFSLYSDAAGTTQVASIGTGGLDYVEYASKEHTQGVYLELSERNTSGIHGFVHIRYSSDIIVSDLNRVEGLISPDYKIKLNMEDGVVYPFGLLYNASSSSELAAEDVRAGLASYDSTSASLTMRDPLIAIDNAGFSVTDSTNQIKRANLRGLTLTNSSMFSVNVCLDGFSLYVYKDNSQATEALVATGTLVPGSTLQAVTLTAQSNSGISGELYIEHTAAGADIVNAGIRSANLITGFSNKELTVRLTVQQGAVNQYHNKIAHLIYLGTDPEKLTSAKMTLQDDANREVGMTINTAAYRPFAFHISFSPEYVFPYKDNATTYANYLLLIELMDTYFSNYTGKVSDLDFAELSSSWFPSTKLYLKKLNWKMYTQRGHAVAGTLELEDSDQTKINWNADIIAKVETTVDPYYTERLMSESQATVQKLYKPLLSRVI